MNQAVFYKVRVEVSPTSRGRLTTQGSLFRLDSGEGRCRYLRASILHSFLNLKFSGSDLSYQVGPHKYLYQHFSRAKPVAHYFGLVV